MNVDLYVEKKIKLDTIVRKGIVSHILIIGNRFVQLIFFAISLNVNLIYYTPSSFLVKKNKSLCCF